MLRERGRDLHVEFLRLVRRGPGRSGSSAERPPAGKLRPCGDLHIVFPGGCVTAQLDGTGAADPAFAAEARSILDFTSRHALQRALEQRSGGRLQLDP